MMQTGLASYDQVNVGIDSHTDFENKKKGRVRISGDQILQMMKDVESRFIQPKPQSELGGQLGVTLSDIADSLGVIHKDLRRKVERSGAIEKITCLNHLIRTYILIPAVGARTESYVMDIEAAQHIVSKYDNAAGWAYTDYLIRCKDALKVSLEEHQRIEKALNQVSAELTESNKKLEAFLQPKLTRRNNIVRRKAVKEPDGLFHEGKYRVEMEIYKQPKKGDENYDEHKVQKLSRIAFGTVGAIEKSCKENNCDSEVLNFVVKRFMECAKYADILINPEDPEQYAETRKELERIMNA